jgi:hypothetical protein
MGVTVQLFTSEKTEHFSLVFGDIIGDYSENRTKAIDLNTLCG